MAKTYWEKLKDPRWQKKRLEIMQRDEFSCQHCFQKDKPLNIHHRLYRKGKNPWDYADEHLVTLCEKCHAETTSKNESILEWMSGPSGTQDAIHCMRDLWETDKIGQSLIASVFSYVSMAHLCVFEKSLSDLKVYSEYLIWAESELRKATSKIHEILRQKQENQPDNEQCN